MGRVLGLTPDQTRERLVEAAAAVLAEQGFEGTRTSDIAKRAGLSTGAIYSQFDNKAELLLAAVSSHAPSELDNLFTSGVRTGSIAETIVALGSELPFTKEALAGVLVEAWSLARRDDEVAAVLRGVSQERREALRAVFDLGQIGGEVDPDAPSDALAWLCLTLVLGAFVAKSQGLAPPDHDDWREVVTRLVETFRAEPTAD